jgi:aerobic carbon-monoxide dehydrogenase medium subunit
MHPPKFDYYRAGSLDEAVALLKQHDGAKVLAGGHSLIPPMKLRLAQPTALIDIGRIGELKGITITRDSGVRIGALTTHAEVAASGDVPAVLREAAGLIGDAQVRNRGTVGGNLAHADPASDLPTVMVALDATFHVVGPNGRRDIPASLFFLDLFSTGLEEGEIMIHVQVPDQRGAGSAYAKLPNPASRYCMVGAAAVLNIDGGTVSQARVAVGGLTPTARRASSVEAALMGQAVTAESIARAAAAVQNDLGDDILSDIHASADYRRAMATVYVKRALMKAAGM